MKVDGLVRGNWFAKTRSPMQVWSLAEAIILMLGARIDSIDCYLSLSLCTRKLLKLTLCTIPLPSVSGTGLYSDDLSRGLTWPAQASTHLTCGSHARRWQCDVESNWQTWAHHPHQAYSNPIHAHVAHPSLPIWCFHVPEQASPGPEKD